MGLSSDASLLSRATNAWAVGAFADGVTTLSTLDRVVWTVGSTTDALPPRMVRTSWRFLPQRILQRGWMLWEHWPVAG
jgi:hypothetical protein